MHGARDAIMRELPDTEPSAYKALPDPWCRARGVFVTLRRRNGVSYGTARGVLLPNIDGVSTYDEQIPIAADKGQLPRDHWQIERLEVEKGAEPLPLTTTRRGDA